MTGNRFMKMSFWPHFRFNMYGDDLSQQLKDPCLVMYSAGLQQLLRWWLKEQSVLCYVLHTCGVLIGKATCRLNHCVKITDINVLGFMLLIVMACDCFLNCQDGVVLAKCLYSRCQCAYCTCSAIMKNLIYWLKCRMLVSENSIIQALALSS